jgi:hypothetical protein
MPIGSRVLNVTLEMPQGSVVLDATLDIKVKVSQVALAIQNKCEIVVSNLSSSLRTSLLSSFTAWNKRIIDTPQAGGMPTQQSYINITVDAGYATPGQPSNVVRVFSGQVVLCDPVGALPDMAVKITAYSQQVNKLNYLTTTPGATTTFANYVAWAAQQMGVNVSCETSYNNRVITNPAGSIQTADALLVDIQNLYHPDVAAFIDSRTNTLVVRDVNKIVSTANVVTVDEFIGPPPSWTAWGVRFQCLFNPAILMTSAVQLQSILNPSLGSAQDPKQYVVYSIMYDLTSRDPSFDMTVDASPPA